MTWATVHVISVWHDVSDVKFMVYTIQCSQFILLFSLYTIQCTLCSVHCRLYSLHCTVYIVGIIWIIYIVHCTLYRVHCPLYTVGCIVYTVLSSLCTTQCLLYNVTMHILQYTLILYSVQCTALCIVHSVEGRECQVSVCGTWLDGHWRGLAMSHWVLVIRILKQVMSPLWNWSQQGRHSYWRRSNLNGAAPMKLAPPIKTVLYMIT